MYFIGAGATGQLWTTSDFGKTYNYYESPDVPSGIRAIYPHPLFLGQYYTHIDLSILVLTHDA